MTSERSLQFKKNYLKLFGQGMSVAEIAEKYGVARCYAYSLIRQIADEVGVSYESLLYQPHTNPQPGPRVIASPTKLADFSLLEEAQKILEFIEEAIRSLEQQVIQEWEEKAWKI